MDLVKITRRCKDRSQPQSEPEPEPQPDSEPNFEKPEEPGPDFAERSFEKPVDLQKPQPDPEP